MVIRTTAQVAVIACLGLAATILALPSRAADSGESEPWTMFAPVSIVLLRCSMKRLSVR